MRPPENANRAINEHMFDHYCMDLIRLAGTLRKKSQF
jgi:hypothetical protein